MVEKSQAATRAHYARVPHLRMYFHTLTGAQGRLALHCCLARWLSVCRCSGRSEGAQILPRQEL